MAEVNQFKWVGVRPVIPYEGIPVFQYVPEGATEVWAYNRVDNERVDVYVVPTGKTLFLTMVIFMVNAISAGAGSLHVRDDTDTLQYYLGIARKPSGEGDTYPISFILPLQIPQNWKICVSSNASNFHSYGFIFGYLI